MRFGRAGSVPHFPLIAGGEQFLRALDGIAITIEEVPNTDQQINIIRAIVTPPTITFQRRKRLELPSQKRSTCAGTSSISETSEIVLKAPSAFAVMTTDLPGFSGYVRAEKTGRGAE